MDNNHIGKMALTAGILAYIGNKYYKAHKNKEILKKYTGRTNMKAEKEADDWRDRFDYSDDFIDRKS